MYPTTPAFTDALNSYSRRWASRVEVLSGSDRIATLDTVESGTVSLDNVAVRRSLDLRIVDPSGGLTPVDARDMLAPRGTEVRVWRGLCVGADVEWVPLGVFGVTEPEVSSDNGATVIKIKAMDRVDTVRKRRFAAPWRVARGTPTDQAIANIITSRLNVPVRITASGHTTPEVVYDELSDPWDAVRELATADSLAAYFDPLGAAVIAPDAEQVVPLVYTSTGLPGSALVTASRSISAEDTYSGVIVRSEHPDHENIKITLWDTDPKSPTYYLGPFGQRPYGFTSPLITSNDQALAAAQTLLRKVTRMRQSATLTISGHPGHEINDLVGVADLPTRTSGSWAVQGAEIPLRPNAGPMTLKIQEGLGA